MGRQPFRGGRPKIAARVARDGRERRRLETAARFGVAPPVYDGAPVLHRHYDAEGNLVGTTEIVSPWDDEARAEAEALWEADQLVCPQCGGLREDCSDPDRPRFPQRHICYDERARSGAAAKFRAKNEDEPYQSWNGSNRSKKMTDKTPFHYSDGVRVYVAPFDVNPEDTFI